MGGRRLVAEDATGVVFVVSPEMRASLSTCRVLTIDWQVRGMYNCLGCARGLCLCPCGITPREFTSLPTQEAEYSFSGFIPINKQTNKQQRFSQYNAITYNPGIFVSDAYYRHGCENDDTERANFKSQYYEQNVSRSRHMAVQSVCKIYWQGGRVDGFEKNASQNTRQSSPQPVNFCFKLACLFAIKFLDLQKIKETTTVRTVRR